MVLFTHDVKNIKDAADKNGDSDGTCRHVQTPSPSLSLSPTSFIIVSMVMARLTGKMGSTPILPVRRAATIDTMIKLEGDGVGTCKQAFSVIPVL